MTQQSAHKSQQKHTNDAVHFLTNTYRDLHGL